MVKCKKLFLTGIVLALAIVLSSPVLSHASNPCAGKKVESFVLLLDLSGSRDDDFDRQMQLQSKLNDAIPGLDFKAALRTFFLYTHGDGSTSQLKWGPGAYSPEGVLEALKGLRRHNARTPLGPAITATANDFAKMSGNKALIIFSDFTWSEGFGSPAHAAKKLKAQFPELCIFTVNFSADADQVKLAEALATAGKCGKSFNAQSLLDDDAAFRTMITDIFITAGADEDGDGVCDAQDKCPGTPPNFKVDANGCPLPVTISLNIEFDTAKAVVKPEYHGKIAEAAKYLQDFPGTTAVVEGHTDARGSDKYNMKLSQARAESVKNYMVDKFGIAASRLTAKGYGESRPIADNKTQAGMQKNRRVDVVVSGAFKGK